MNGLTDKKLIALLKDSVKLERKAVIEIIEYLKEVQRRRLFSDYGYSSLHAFCTGELGYSDGETSRKIRTIKLVAILPKASQMIINGSLNLTNASTLFTHINKEQSSPAEQENLLKQIKNKSTRETERILAEKTCAGGNIPAESKKAIKGKRISVKFSIDEGEYEKLEFLMKELGTNSMEDLILKMSEIIQKKKEIKPRKTAPRTKTGYISARIRREVLKRDKHQCVICGSKNHIQLDHIVPVGKNGNSSISNLRVTCKSCNLRFAIKEYGQQKMNPFINSKII